MQQMGLDVKQLVNSDTIPRMRENAKPEALGNLKKSLILAEIANKESLNPDEAAIKDKMAEIAKELTDQQVDEEKLAKLVEEDLITENTLDWLREKAEVELVPAGSLAEKEEEAEAESETVEAEVVEAAAVEVESEEESE